MLFGNPEKFAFVIEKVPEWSDESFANGLLYVFIKWEMYPNEVRNTTISDDLQFLLDKERPYGMYYLVNDKELYALSDKKLFAELRRVRCPWLFFDDDDEDQYPEEDYRFDLELDELSLARYNLFAISNGRYVRILIGHWDNPESFELVNSVRITLKEFTKIRDELWEYYEKEILR